MDDGKSAWLTVTDVCAVGKEGPAPLHVYVVLPPSQVFPLLDGAEISFGRASECTISVDDARVSRRHAVIRRQGGDVFVRDLGSRNGTRAGSAVLRNEEGRVTAGDRVVVGPIEVLIAAVTEGTQVGIAPNQASPEWVAEREERNDELTFDGIIVADPSMQKVFRVARKLAQASAAVVITGETGSGKEVVAQQIHAWSPRSSGPFVRLNCAAIPENLLESELFGYERGAFTGADRRKIGFVEAANGGTLLLDEIGDMPLNTQVKLLRVLEQKAITRVGGTKEIPVDVRVVCATHRDLKAEVSAGRFREDLFYRISTFKLHVPPLRERQAETMLLAELFAGHFAERMGIARPQFSAHAAQALVAYAWPGNVRELRNVIEHAVVMAEDGIVEVDHLPTEVNAAPVGQHAATLEVPLPHIRQQLAEEERRVLTAALVAEGWNQTRAAKRLGITRRMLIYKMQKLKVARP